MPEPQRGEIWLTDLSPTRGREEAGQRAVLVFSVDEFNEGPAELRPIPLHVIVQLPEGGLKTQSRILTDAIRSISKERLIDRWGTVSPETMAVVEDRVRTLLGL